MCINELNIDLRARRQPVRTCPLRDTTELKVSCVSIVLISVYILKLLTNEKRGGLKVVAFDRSRFKHQEPQAVPTVLLNLSLFPSQL
jgi:hypothetical protein